MNYKSLHTDQASYFSSGQTRPLGFRLEQLEKLEWVIEKHGPEILEALNLDLRKSEFEAYSSEVGFVLEDIRHTRRNLKAWMRGQEKAVPLIFSFSRAQVHFEPLGQVLVMAPWNYPFQLLLSPAVAALAAGNVVMLKPSELAPHTSRVIAQMIEENFSTPYLTVVEGGQNISEQLLTLKFDHIFFTGSPRVGKIIMEKAAQFLTPVTLELGGKSPCIVDKTADIKVAAKRIAWGKFYNAGQTCVAPDYLLLHKQVKDSFLNEFKKTLLQFYGASPKASPDYGRIINRSHFDRLLSYMKDGKILIGGDSNPEDLYISPTVLSDLPPNARVMEEEIFGPILPIVEINDGREALGHIQRHSHPLALYLFAHDSKLEHKIIQDVPFGGGCINDTLIHLGVQELPFGGVGTSGMGAYHGHRGFLTFSHQKSVLKHATWFDPWFRYPPYKNKMKWLTKIR